MIEDAEKLLEHLSHNQNSITGGPYYDGFRECLKMWRKEQAKPSGWLPIESAPKDGTSILIIGKWKECSKAYWADNCEFGNFETKPGWQIYQCEDSFYSCGVAESEIKGWQPLPPAPGGE